MVSVMKALALLTVWYANSRGLSCVPAWERMCCLTISIDFITWKLRDFGQSFYGAVEGLLLWMGMIIECLHNLGTMPVLSEV